MIAALLNFLVIVFVFSILIIVHELGHFIAARASGVRVTDFAIGFGPPFFKKKIKDTNFLICSVPLGGYIKMAGDSRSESRGYKDEFFSKPAGIRSKIVFAGPLFNYIFAFIIFFIIVTLGFQVQDTFVGAVQSGSPAEKAGIEEGDRIVAVDNKRVDSWTQLQDRIGRTKESVVINLYRKGESVELDVATNKRETQDRFGRQVEASYIGIFSYGPVVGELINGYPAQEAGIKPEDRILKIDGKEVRSWNDVVESIKDAEESVFLKVKRGEDVFSLEVPVKKEARPDKEDKQYISVIGIKPFYYEKVIKEPFPFSLIKAGGMLLDTTSSSLKGLWYMATDSSISFRESVGGPLYISYMISKTTAVGFDVLLQLVALLSVFLFIINLFPIPVFDGGHLLFFGIEKLRGKPLSPKVEDIAMRIGLFLIVLLVFFVFYNDIVRRGPQIWEYLRSFLTNGTN